MTQTEIIFCVGLLPSIAVIFLGIGCIRLMNRVESLEDMYELQLSQSKTHREFELRMFLDKFRMELLDKVSRKTNEQQVKQLIADARAYEKSQKEYFDLKVKYQKICQQRSEKDPLDGIDLKQDLLGGSEKQKNKEDWRKLWDKMEDDFMKSQAQFEKLKNYYNIK